MGIGNEKPYSLCGDFISQFWIIRSAEKMERQKLYISTKRTTIRKHFLAVNFEAFISGLVNEGNYESEAQELAEDRDLEE